MYEPGGKQAPTAPGPQMTAWRTVLEAIPTVFGRLLFLRSLPDCADPVIGYAALQAFSYWLRLGISEQLRDLRSYIDESGGKPPADYARLVPPTARDVERQLFLTDMETLVGLLRVERDPPSSML